MSKLIVLLTIFVVAIACKAPVQAHQVELFVGSKEISKVVIDGKSLDLESSPERVYVLQLNEGSHVVSWTVAGKSIHSTNFSVSGPGSLSLRRVAPFIDAEDGVTATPLSESKPK